MGMNKTRLQLESMQKAGQVGIHMSTGWTGT